MPRVILLIFVVSCNISLSHKTFFTTIFKQSPQDKHHANDLVLPFNMICHNYDKKEKLKKKN